MQSRSDAIRGYFAAFKSGDRAHLERAMTEDFTFTSPYDDGIDKAAYFARCWPNRGLIREHAIDRIFEQGDEAFVLYRCQTADGKTFHNTEFFTFRGERLHVSPREMALTELLLGKAGRVVPKESIVAALSSWEADFSENSVEVYVHRLRKRFADLGVVIRTVRGFGYMMELSDAP